MQRPHSAPQQKFTAPRGGVAADVHQWNSVGEEWAAGSPQMLWRRHSDWAWASLVSRWMPKGGRAVLKTDLFDEAISEGLFAPLHDRSAEVHGVDIAASTVQAAQRRHPGLKAQVADIKALPYPDGMFDTVVSLSTLDHFAERSEIDQSLREIRRVTATGGKLLLTLDNPMNPKIALRGALPQWILFQAGLVPYPCGVTLPRDALVAAIESAGFRVIEVTAILHCPRVLAIRLGAIFAALSLPRCERALLRVLPWFETLERWPTRWRTGHFTAVLAEARD